jgi:hypothetical protein
MFTVFSACQRLSLYTLHALHLHAILQYDLDLGIIKSVPAVYSAVITITIGKLLCLHCFVGSVKCAVHSAAPCCELVSQQTADS